MDKYLQIVARILLAQLFILSGFSKISSYAGTQGYMTAMSVPSALLPLVILLELGGGLALLAGVMTRWVALALAGFALLTAVIFHHNFADQMQMINFMKNLAIAGGLLLLVQHGASAPSVDSARGSS